MGGRPVPARPGHSACRVGEAAGPLRGPPHSISHGVITRVARMTLPVSGRWRAHTQDTDHSGQGCGWLDPSPSSAAALRVASGLPGVPVPRFPFHTQGE